MPDDDRRDPQRRHQRPKGARPSGTSDAPDMAGTVHYATFASRFVAMFLSTSSVRLAAFSHV
jgi:hypothetical protein